MWVPLITANWVFINPGSWGSPLPPSQRLLLLSHSLGQRVTLGQDWNPRVWWPRNMNNFRPMKDNTCGCCKPSKQMYIYIYLYLYNMYTYTWIIHTWLVVSSSNLIETINGYLPTSMCWWKNVWNHTPVLRLFPDWMSSLVDQFPVYGWLKQKSKESANLAYRCLKMGYRSCGNVGLLDWDISGFQKLWQPRS